MKSGSTTSACLFILAMALFLSPPAHADISGAIISVSVAPATPVEDGILTGSCSVNNPGLKAWACVAEGEAAPRCSSAC